MVLIPATAGKQHAFSVAPMSQWVAGLTLTKAANKAALIAVAELKGLISARIVMSGFLLHHVASMKCFFIVLYSDVISRFNVWPPWEMDILPLVSGPAVAFPLYTGSR